MRGEAEGLPYREHGAVEPLGTGPSPPGGGGARLPLRPCQREGCPELGWPPEPSPGLPARLPLVELGWGTHHSLHVGRRGWTRLRRRLCRERSRKLSFLLRAGAREKVRPLSQAGPGPDPRVMGCRGRGRMSRTSDGPGMVGVCVRARQRDGDREVERQLRRREGRSSGGTWVESLGEH